MGIIHLVKKIEDVWEFFREINGVRYRYRRNTCTRCGGRYSTAEIPLEVAEDVFGEDV